MPTKDFNISLVSILEFFFRCFVIIFRLCLGHTPQVSAQQNDVPLSQSVAVPRTKQELTTTPAIEIVHELEETYKPRYKTDNLSQGKVIRSPRYVTDRYGNHYITLKVTLITSMYSSTYILFILLD